MLIRGRSALVTGASGGIGSAVAGALAEAGASRLVLSGRDPAALDAVVRRTGGRPVLGDLTSPSGLRAVADAAAGTDVLVLAAGVGWAGELVDMPEEALRDLLAADVAATMELARRLVPGAVARRAGHVVLVGSIAGVSASQGRRPTPRPRRPSRPSPTCSAVRSSHAACGSPTSSPESSTRPSSPAGAARTTERAPGPSPPRGSRERSYGASSPTAPRCSCQAGCAGPRACTAPPPACTEPWSDALDEPGTARTGPAREPAAGPPAASVLEATACRAPRQARAENFPVAPWVLGPSLRRHLSAVYVFARFVDDLADEAPGDRRALLAAVAADVDRLYAGRRPVLGPVAQLGPTVRRFGIPAQPLHDLVQAGCARAGGGAL